MNPLIPGLGLILTAALANGLFPLPLRISRHYAVENTMMLAMGIATIVVPMIAIYWIFPGWWSSMSTVGIGTVALVIALGFSWGIGNATYGFGIAALGLSVGFAVILGIGIAVGSMMPLIRRWDEVPWNVKWVILLGVAISIVGVAVCGKAGKMRDRQSVITSRTGGKSKFLLGLALCIFSGLTSAGQNLAFDYSEPIGREAVRRGISPLFATVPRWVPIFWGGYAAIFAFMLVKMLKDRTYKRFSGPGSGRDFVLASAMGLLHCVIVAAYGMATVYLGSRLGTSVGYALFIASSIMVANTLGFVTGEWKGAPKSAVKTLYAALGLLILSIVVLSAASSRFHGGG